MHYYITQETLIMQIYNARLYYMSQPTAENIVNSLYKLYIARCIKAHNFKK